MIDPSDSRAVDDDGVLAGEAARAGRRVRRHARRRRDRQSRRVVRAVAVAGAGAAVLAGCEPTGVALADAFWAALFAGVITISAARARRWTWFVAGGVAGAAGADELVPLVLAGASLATGFASLRFERRQRMFGAVVGALVANALLRLPTDLPTLVPSLIAALAPLPLVVSGLRNDRRGLRRYAWPAAGLALVLGVIGAAFVWGMLDASGHASDGLSAARRGLDAAGRDDGRSETAFARAEAELAEAEAIADEWWLAPARVLPVLAPHVDVVDRVAAEGRAVASLSVQQAETLDVTGLGTPDGGIDLSRVEALTPGATDVAASLARADQVLDDVRSPWLVGPATARLDEFAREVERVLPTAELAADALAVAPDLLGATTPRAYLVLVGNPAEARELGGFTAAVGVLSADGGDLDFTPSRGVNALNRQVADSGLAIEGELPPPLPASEPERFVQNWTNTADFLTTADVAARLGPAIVGGDVDGVLYLDPYAVARLLELSGPVPVEGRPEPLGADDAVDFLLREQYSTAVFDDDGQRKDALGDAAEAALDQLLSGSLPDPRRFAEVLSPTVRARRLLFTASGSLADDSVDDVLGRVGLRAPLDVGSTDQLLVAQQNLRANKLDAYLSRSVHYDLDVDTGDGRASGTITVELTNETPEGLDDYVTGDGGLTRTATPLPERLNRTALAVYSRLPVSGVTVDGEPSGQSSFPVGDLYRTSTRVDVPADGAVTVVFSVEGGLDLRRGYDLAVVPNATATTDELSAEVRTSSEVLPISPRPLDQIVHIARTLT